MRNEVKEPANLLRKLLPSVLVNGAVPLLAYTLLSGPLGSGTTALAVAAAIPVVFTAAKFVMRHRLDPLGVLAIVGYAVALIVLVLSNGNDLVLKLHEAVVTGPLGLVCLVSVVVGKPLHGVVLNLMSRRNPQLPQGNRPELRKISMIMTTLIGATLVLHALVLLVLALGLPTGTYLAVSHPIGLCVLAAGIAAMLWYRNRLRART